MNASVKNVPRVTDLPAGLDGYQVLFFSELQKRPVCAGKLKDRVGRLTDLVFALKEPYPEAVGIYMEYGWGKPAQFVPWDHVLRIEPDAIFVRPPADGADFAPFVDQPGWILADKHLMGRTILDMDGRRTEVVNDVHLLESKGRVLLVHVDISINGWLRRWGLGRLRWIRDNFISWKVVQPLSVEDAVATDKVSLSVTRGKLKELPSEDLADALEELRGEAQEALFSALDSEKAAETLIEAEPRAQRQIIANLRKERARQILEELSTPQLANLLSVLPHDDVEELLALVPAEMSAGIRGVLAEREATSRTLMTTEFFAAAPGTTVGEVLADLRRGEREPDGLAYIYVVQEETQRLAGVVDLREIVLAPAATALSELMAAPVVSADDDDTLDDVSELFAKYHFRMIPVVDAHDRLLGIVHYNDIVKGRVAR